MCGLHTNDCRRSTVCGGECDRQRPASDAKPRCFSTRIGGTSNISAVEEPKFVGMRATSAPPAAKAAGRGFIVGRARAANVRAAATRRELLGGAGVLSAGLWLPGGVGGGAALAAPSGVTSAYGFSLPQVRMPPTPQHQGHPTAYVRTGTPGRTPASCRTRLV